MVPPPEAREDELGDTPMFDMTRCWVSPCDDDARHTRYVNPNEPIRLCEGHVEAWDERVAAALKRLQTRSRVRFPTTERKETA